MSNESSLFFIELTKWLLEKGFVNDRGWNKEEEGLGFYSYVKGNFRFEIKTNWNIKYDFESEISVQIKDCTKEVYCDAGYIGWLGQNVLISLKKPFSRQLFDGLCEYYEIKTKKYNEKNN